MSPSNKILEVWLNENNVSYLKNVKLSSLSWLKAGGINEIMIFPQNLNECELITKFFLDNKINYYPVGNLSNIIFRDGNFVTPLICIEYFNATKSIHPHLLALPVVAPNSFPT